MASPFQLDPNAGAGNIPGVQQRGGFDPVNPNQITDSVSDLLGTAGNVLVERNKRQIQEDVAGQTKALEDALKVSAFPSLEKQLFSAEALQNPGTKAAFEQFSQIKNAIDQGILPADYALDRLETIQNDAIARNPEFEKEIRAAMQDASGISPVARQFSRLLNPEQTPAAKLQAKVHEQAVLAGLTDEEYLAAARARSIRDQRLGEIDFARQNGEYSLDLLGQEVQTHLELVGQGLIESIALQVNQGGIVDKEAQKVQLRQAVDAAKSQVRAGVRAAAESSAAGGTVGFLPTQADVDRQIAALDTMYDNWASMIDEGDMEKMLVRNNSIVKQFAIRDVQGIPVLGKVYSAFGADNMFDILEEAQKWAGNPAFGQKASAKYAATSKLLDGLTKIGSGDKVQTDEERFYKVAAAGMMLSLPGVDPEKQVAAQEELSRYGGEDLAFSAYESPKVLRNVARSKQLQAAFVQLQQTHTKGLVQEYIRLSEQFPASLAKVAQNENGTLSLSLQEQVTQAEQRARGTALGVGATTAQTPAVATPVASFMDKMNRAVRVSQKYHDAGILPASRYTDAPSYWSFIQREAAALQAGQPLAEPVDQPKPTVVRFVRDSEGRIVRAE